ncbi:hypothetical protein Mapa_003265 [Marchantia paleacea]|nr:hypothetical protein Mapa_003265 [Marchantia paleacea]
MLRVYGCRHHITGRLLILCICHGCYFHTFQKVLVLSYCAKKQSSESESTSKSGYGIGTRLEITYLPLKTLYAWSVHCIQLSKET